MYRILLVDDEALEREGLEWIIRRSFSGEFEVLHAENGRRAIELAEEKRPHIVFMDVNMPGIQGLAALREIRSRLPDAKFVLVTAYDYFAYAQEAVSLGAKEYIVKPASQEQIVGLLYRLREELNREKTRRTEELALRDRVSQLMPMAENELSLLLMSGPELDEEGRQFAEWLDFPLDVGLAIVAAFPESGYTGQERKLFRSFHSLAETFAPAVCSSLINRHMVLFLRKSPGSTAEAWMAEVRDFAAKLARQTEQLFRLPLRIGIGMLRARAEGLHHSYFEAVFASTFAEEGGEPRFFGELRTEADSTYSPPQAPPAASAAAANPLYVANALQAIREEREQETASVIGKAKRFIDDHFTEDLSLDQVAEHVHLNAFYFSKIFKQRVGETFIDYLTKLRIGKAKAFIEEGALSLKEICYRVGYRDPNYFSRVFRKVTGITPSDYRDRDR
ncbi:AraC family transcriptional regulator [Gorillibacterium sp. sgz500922]|uniref:AraC family transcriptional regulator n=1 Tax=Gorillibacterium sp. sgz500922 TaxID=3446694 RepID=UPI003F66C4CD